MEPLKITIRLKTPMVDPGALLHLDGLLGALRVDQAKALQGENINPRDYHYDIPVERHSTESGEWVFKASAFRATMEAQSSLWMQTGRLSITQAADHRAEGYLKLRGNKPNIAGGPFKTSIYRFPILWAELTAYCVGDLQGVRDLLASCKQIGPRRGAGFGQISEIVVEQVPEKECNWSYRAMPEECSGLVPGHVLAVGALRAPYWDKTMHCKVLVPTE